MRKPAVLVWMVIAVLIGTSLNLKAAPVPDTGMTKCYSDTSDEMPCPAEGEAYYGQDGNYNINAQSYTKLGYKGKVLIDTATAPEWIMTLDNVTGLVWEMKTDDGSIHDKDNTYTWYDPTDPSPGTQGNGTDTLDFINKLKEEKFGGFDDWRLPTIHELYNIVNKSVSHWSNQPTIESIFFPNTISNYYWSSTTSVINSICAWTVFFYDAYYSYDYFGNKSNFNYVRAVRGGQPGTFASSLIPTGLDRYKDNEDQTVSDALTGLMWQKDMSDIITYWENALAYCESSRHAGFTDWRLPSIYEIGSIVDFNRSNFAIDPVFIINGRFFWSSTTYLAYAGYNRSVWTMDFNSGKDALEHKLRVYYSNNVYARAVRGGQNRLPGHLFITAPAQAEFLPIGSLKVIQWKTPQEITGNVKISLSTDGGKIFNEIATVSNTGNYSWTVPGPEEVNCMLKIEPVNDPSKGTVQGLFTMYTSTGGAVLKVDPTQISITKDAGTTAINVSNTGTGNMPWTAAVTSGTTWFRIKTGYNSGDNTGTILCEYDPNTDTADRIAIIRVAATNAKNSPIDVSVTQARSLGNLIILPSSAAFPSLYLGDTSTIVLTVTSTLDASVTIDSTSITGSDDSHFSLGDNCSGKVLEKNDYCIITANFKPLGCGDKSATLTVATTHGNLTAGLSGSACGSGTASLNGTVRDAVTLQSLTGAAVSVGSNGPYSTNSFGKYQSGSLASGTYELNVSRQGYDTFIGTITLQPQQSAVKDILLKPATASGVRVTSITSKYSSGSPYYFLPGISFDVAFTANVDWSGRTPGKVRFITSKGSYDVPTSGNTATKTINIGTECSSCSTLQAVAIPADAEDNEKSPAAAADFIVTNPLPVDPDLPFINSLAVEKTDSSFSYRSNISLSKNLLEQTVGDFDKIPILKNSETLLRHIPEFDFEFSGNDGSAKYVLSLEKNREYLTIKDTIYSKRKNEHGFRNLAKSVEHLIQEGKVDRRHFPKTEIASFGFSFFPVIQGEYSFNAAKCAGSSFGWSSMTGSVGLAGGAQWGVIYQSLLPPPFPIPYYFKPAIGIEFDGMMNINDAINLKLSGDLSATPYISGTIGVGVNDVVGLEGTGKGGVDIAWQFPVSAGQNAITDCSAFLSITGKVYFLVFTKDIPILPWNEDCFHTNSASKGINGLLPTDLQSDSSLSLIPRDYLNSPNALAFQNKPVFMEKRFSTSEQAYSTFSSPIVTGTFPVSAAHLSSGGSHVNLIYLTDNASRSSINRTMAVHSIFDGISWSTPVSIADNGTADFNPTWISLADGNIMTAWEDVDTILADTATFEEVTAQLEIAAAIYDPIAKTWGAAIRLTDNQTLDRTPKLAGKDMSNILLTWISNEQNDTLGSAAHPNQLKYAFYNGTGWSTPQTAAVIPNQINRYNVVYDGATANVVLALDTDNNPSTLEDMELYRMVYSNGAWGTLTRLTNDTLIDDNPQLFLDPDNNLIMNWVKDKELSSVANFDFTNRTIILSEEAYNSSLADFRQATTPDGRIAVIYTNISENNTCDLFGIFYDPIFKLWGLPKQFTDDAETEQWPSIAFLGTDTIISTCNRKLLIDQTGNPTAGESTDLYMVKHTLTDDLAVEAGSLTADISNAAPGTAVTLSAKVQNLGDNTAQNISVSFYLGNPSSGGTLIGTVVISNPLKPGDSVIVSLPWTIPAGTAPVTIYVVVDPGSAIDTLNRTNNVTSTTLGLPDLKIQKFTAEKLGSNRYNLVVSVANIGGTTSGTSNIKLHFGSSTRTVIATLGLPSLARFASVDLSYDWSTSALAQSDIVLVAVADEGNTINESNESNNSYQITLKGEPVLSVSPAIRYPAKEAGTTTFSVSNTGTGTMPWTAAVTSGSSWLSITSGAKGSNAGTITCAFPANTGSVSRTGTIRVTASDATGSPVDVTVTQDALSLKPVISGTVKTGTGTAISGVTITFSNNGGTATTDTSGNYSKTVNTGWSGTATPSQTGYTFTPASKTYSNVTANQTGQDYTGIPSADKPVLSVTPIKQNVGSASGTTGFSVSNTGTGTMPWTAVVTSGNSWLSITSGSSGSNTGTIACSFTANTGNTSRTGTIRVSAAGATGSPMDVIIEQAGLSDGLVAAYPCNGNANDESGNGNDGVNYGATPTSDRFGKTNCAFYFDGVSNYIDIGKIASKLDGVKTGSISVWFNTDEKVRGKTLLSYHKNESYISGYITLGQYTNYLSNESIGGVIAPSVDAGFGVGFGYNKGNDYLMDGKWHNAVFVMGTNYNALYMDGEKVSLTYFNNGSRITGNSNTGNIMWSEIEGALIGKTVGTANSAYNYKGSIDDVLIYNRALSEAEIKHIFIGGLNVLPANRNVSNTSGTTTFSVSNTGTSTMPWNAVVTAGGDWLSITSGSSGTNAGTITCAYKANTGTTSRTGTIRVTATGVSGSPKDVTVTQAETPAQPVVSVSPVSRDVAKEAGTTTFSVSNTGTGTMPWTAAVTSGGSWLRITSGASGSNAGTITCAFDANTTTASRTGSIRITATGATGSPKDVTVTQAAASASPLISGSVKTSAGETVSGVTLTFNNNGGTATTDSSGNYSKSIASGWSGTATPAKSGYTFTPVSKTYSNVTTNQTGQNYIASIAGYALFDDFNDGNFTVNPAWTEWNQDDYPGKVEVKDNTIHFLRTGAGGNGGSVQILMDVDIPVTDETKVFFDGKAVSRTVGNGCGWTCGEYPANFQIRVLDAANKEIDVRYCINYGSAIKDYDDAAFKQKAVSVPQNEWVRNMTFRVRDICPSAVRIEKVTLFGAGWDFDGYLDNVGITSAGALSPSQFWGAWSDGVWMLDKASGKWAKIPSTSNALKIASGKVDTDTRDDLIGVWSSGLWVRFAASGQWVKLSSTLPTWIAAGDINNDGRDDTIGSWANDGVYYRDSASGKWNKVSSPATQLASGNIGGVRDDLAGVWNTGIWVRYSATATWQKIDNALPTWMTTGDMSGDNRADIIGSYTTGTWYRNSATAAWVKLTSSAMQLAAGDLNGDGRDDLIGVWADGVWVRYAVSNQWQKITSSRPVWITTGKMGDALQTIDSDDDQMDVIDLSEEGPGCAVTGEVGREAADPETMESGNPADKSAGEYPGPPENPIGSMDDNH